MRAGVLVSAALLLAGRSDGAERLIPVDVLFGEPATYSYELSPDSRYLAAHLNMDGSRHLVLVDTSNARSYDVIDFKNMSDLFLQDLEWIDDDTLFLHIGSIGQPADNIAFLDFRFVNGVPQTTTHRTRAKGQLVDPLPDVDDTVLFAREGLRESAYRLYWITVDQLERSDFEEAADLTGNLHYATFYGLDPGSGELLAATAEEELIRIWYLDESRDRWIQWFEHDPQEFQFIPVGRLDDATFAVLTNKDTDRMSLVEFDVNRKAFGEVLYQHPRYDLTGAEVEGGFVRSVSYVDHGSTVTEYFTASDSHLAGLLRQAFPGKHAQLLSPADAGSKAVLYVSAANDPGTYYLLDTRTGEAQGLSTRNPEVLEYDLARSRVFDVRTSDGEQVEAILTIPEEPNGVLLVNPHGGPIGIRDYASYDAEVQFFANRGYSVLNVNFRGSSGFGKEFLETGRGQFGKRIEEDISAVVRQVTAERDFTDLCAIGASYGGYSAMMLSIRHPELYRCVVSIFGIFDLPLLFNTSNYTLLEERQRLLASVVGEYSEPLRDISPFYLAEKVPAPVLLIAATDDHIADIEQTNRLKYRLEQLSKPVEYFYYANTGHGHSNWSGDRHQFALVDDFIRRTLGLEPPAGDNAAEVVGGEYELIAEYFEGSGLVEDNIELAARYYEKAAALDNTTALYRLAQLYDDGSELPQDLERARAYLLRASELGNVHATYWLATLYRDGNAGNLLQPIDPAYSLELFRKAEEEGHTLAHFDIARALCTGSGVEPDLERCLSMLVLDQDGAQDSRATERRRKRMRVFGKIAWSPSPDSAAAARIAQFIGTALEASSARAELDFLAPGLLRDGRPVDEPIPSDLETRFGIEFRLDASDAPNDRVVIKGRLTGPETQDPKGRIIEEFVYVADDGEREDLFYEIVDGRDRVEGAWQLELRTLDGEMLGETAFQVGNPDAARPRSP